jgi:hypothetical protein
VVQQSLSLASLGCHANAELDLAVAKRAPADKPEARIGEQTHATEHGPWMVHEIAAYEVEPVSDAGRLDITREEQEARILEPPTGKDVGARAHHEPAATQHRPLETVHRRPGGGQTDVGDVRVQ